jgi:hypothetical protein
VTDVLGMRHPFSKALYEQDGHGNVRVTLNGKSGLFRPDGAWIEGDIYEADPQLCGWIGGPKVAHHRIQRSQA